MINSSNFKLYISILWEDCLYSHLRLKENDNQEIIERWQKILLCISYCWCWCCFCNNTRKGNIL